LDIEGGSYDMVGTMWWTNDLNAADGSQPVGSPWTITNVPLAVGNNRITVTAEDSGGFPSYSEVTINRRGTPLTYYVSTNGGNIYPYTNWATAAQVIQDAVDAAVAGDLVLVSNGVYDAGGMNAPGHKLTNRVYLSKAVTVESVNGPSNTVITGSGPHSDAAVRCAYLTNGAVLSGFTLTNGHTVVVTVQSLDRCGAGALLDGGGMVSNCIVSGCEAYFYGGGVYCEQGGTVENCTIEGNVAAGSSGGGIYCNRGGEISASRIWNNQADNDGGGFYFYQSGTVSRCMIQGNIAGVNGGGAYGGGGRLYNSLIAGNVASNQGGGVWGQQLSTVANCTVVDNEAVNGEAGGMRMYQSGPVYNCVIYSNRAGSYPNARDVSSSTFDYNCTTPSLGSNCITNEPLLRNIGGNDYRLDYFSPCRDAGNNSYAAGDKDLQGQDRIQNGTVDLGAYEYPLGTDTGDSPVHYVWTNSPSPNWPYTNWATAGRVIQEVVDTAGSGDMVLATNGMYDIGGALTPGYALTNRVMIDKAISLQSVNGADDTFIVGASDHGTNGPSAVRCVYLVTNASLNGFTLTNGYTMNTGEWNLERGGGGVLLYHGGSVLNCIITDCSAGRHGGGVNMHHGGSVIDCMIRNNHSEVDGGGVFQEGSTARIEDCDIDGNTADSNGGGVYSLNGGLATECVMQGNSAGNDGGGYYLRNSGGSAVNCLVTANEAGRYGGGVYVYAGDDVLNCTIVNNTAGSGGGGTAVEGAGTLENCIIYFNTNNNCIGIGGGAGPAYSYVCTTPDPGGTGIVTNDPQVVSSNDFRLQAGSPCIDAGTNRGWMAGARDLVDSARIKGDAVDMGCYEKAVVHSGSSPIHYASVTGNDVWPYTNWTDAALSIQDAVGAADSGEAVHVAEGVYSVGSAVTPGYYVSSRVMIDKPLTLLGVNGPSNTVIVGQSHAGGFGSNAVRGIYVGTNAFVSGFTVSNGYTRGWQDEKYYLDKSGGGIYMRSGAVVSNVIVRNCQAWYGGGGVYVGGATLVCSVVQNNYCDQYGGGVYGGYITQCEIRDNEVGLHGGGIYEYKGTIDSCLIKDNDAGARGGGISFDFSQDGRAVNCLIKGNKAVQLADAVWIQSSTLQHCTIVSNRNGNEPIYGPHDGIIRNCIIVDNDGSVGDDYSRIEFTCTDDASVPAGTGNITNDPQFVDAASGDYQLLDTSPCIDTGTNLMDVTDDFNGMWRPLDGDADGSNAVDMGCYEFISDVADSDGDTMLDGWEHDHDLDPTDPSDASGNDDGDYYSNREEHTADTNPHDSNSFFRLNDVDNSASCVITFVCTNSRVYSLTFTTNLVSGPWSVVGGQSSVTGALGGTMSLTDTVDSVQRSYRVGVSLP
jgi:hypothetical protein